MKKNIIIIGCIIVVIVLAIILLCCKKSNGDYYYKATLNENMINYDLEIIDGKDLNGGLYDKDGEWLSDLISGHAIVNENDIKDYPNFKIKVDEKTYTIKKK